MGRGRGGGKLELGDQAGGGEREEGAPSLRSQAVVMRVTVIEWLSLCVSLWLCNYHCVTV